MQYAAMINKMISFYGSNIHDIDHFLKVHAYASLIGTLEKLDTRTQNILEISAIVHDISCPLCREKYGNTAGHHQEKESEALLRPFLDEFVLEPDILERVIYLVSHHHTVSAVDGIDFQILIEADYLVNASESHFSEENIIEFLHHTAITDTAKRLICSMYSV